MSQPDNSKIDSLKLIFHPHRVVQWFEGKTIHPDFIEITPSKNCNHRYSFCAKDSIGYPPFFWDTEKMLKWLVEFGSLGVSSIMYNGSGNEHCNRLVPYGLSYV